MTEQEIFWAGEFGDLYTSRNTGDKMIESNVSLFSDILCKTKGVHSILELGCNTGLNLAAIDYVDPSIMLTGIDVNAKALLACAKLFEAYGKEQPFTYHSTIEAFETEERFDMVFTKGVLIHIPPEQLAAVYDKMYQLSNKYIMVAEYYNPVVVEVPYRGHNGKLWKRDFAGELIDRFDLKLVKYGFVYRRDKYSQDDISWFLLSKE